MTGWRRAAMIAAALFLLSLVPRVIAAVLFAGEPVWDGHYYDFGARRIAAGLGYSDDIQGGIWHPWCHYPVGYSAYLGAFYTMFGTTQRVGTAVNVVTGALLAPATFALARSGLGDRRGGIAGALVALHPGLILYSTLTMTEQLAALATTTAFAVAFTVRGRKGLVAGALLLGLACLVRPQALLCAPILGLALTAKELPAGRWLRWVLPCALTLLPVLPWTARNCRVMDGCALVSTNAGWNLAIGAFPRATGRFETLRSSDGCRDVTGQVQQDRCWFAYGVQHIRQAPLRWVALVPKKLSYTFDHESFAVGYLHEGNPSAWPAARQSQARDLLTTFHRWLVCAAVLGGIARRLRGFSLQTGLLGLTAVCAWACLSLPEPAVWPLALAAAVLPWLPLPDRPARAPAVLISSVVVLTTAAAHAAFFGEDRYHMVATPALCVLVAAALRRPELRAA